MSAVESNRNWLELLGAWISPSILLVALLAGFMRFHQYPIWSLDAFLALTGIAIFGLIFGALAALAGRTPNRFFVFIAVLVLALDLQTTEAKLQLMQFKLAIVGLVGNSVIEFLLYFLICAGLSYVLATIAKLVAEFSGTIMLSMSAAFLFGVLVVPSQSISISFGNNSILRDSDISSASDSVDRQKVLHLVLDGHIGAEGIPTNYAGGVELKKRVLDFYEQWGFRLFGKVYSPYFYTLDSLPSMLNGRYNIKSLEHITSPKFSSHFASLADNRYFADATAQGRSIRVIQSDYLDFCTSADVIIERCINYPVQSIQAVKVPSLTSTDRAFLILAAYIRKSFLYVSLQRLLGEGVAEKLDFGLPPGMQNYTPLAATGIFQLIETELRSGPENLLLFAHLLLPHEPYIWDHDCKLRLPLTRWRSRKLLYDEEKRESSSEYHALAYQDYFEQMHCTIDLLELLLTSLSKDNLLENLSIIVHSDHGSRITLNDPMVELRGRITVRDYVDTFSTHFAIRDINPAASYDTNSYTTVELFASEILKLNTPEMSTLQLRAIGDNNKEKAYMSAPMVDF